MRRMILTFPFLVFFGLGVFLAGFPWLLPASPSTGVLPEGLLHIWQASYSTGGLAVVIGVLSRRPGIEAFGLALMGGPFLVQAFLTVEVLGAPGWRSGLFLLCAGLGLLFRFAVILWIAAGEENGENGIARSLRR